MRVFKSASPFFLILGDEKAGDVGGKNTEEADAGDHEHGGHDAAFRGDGIFVAVTDRGDGGEGPPDRILGGFDIGIRRVFNIEHRDG